MQHSASLAGKFLGTIHCGSIANDAVLARLCWRKRVMSIDCSLRIHSVSKTDKDIDVERIE